MARAIAGALCLLLSCPAARAYIHAGYTLGRVLQESTNVLLVQVDRVDRENNLIVFRKVKDLKGVHPGQVLNHNIGRGGYLPREWQYIMAWAEVGKPAVFFHNGAAGEMVIENYWYQAAAGEWWRMVHGDPFMLRTFAGRPERLAVAVQAMLAGQEVVIPCMADGNPEALHVRAARVLRAKASLALLDFNPARDFAGWGAEEFRPIEGMPGFSQYAGLPRVDPDAAGIAVTDFNGDRKPDLCLFGGGRLVLLQNTGTAFNEFPAEYTGSAKAAAWADFDGNGKPDLLAASPAGPVLLVNDGDKFRDLSGCLPREGYCNVAAIAWIDADLDGRPDILLADGFRGLRLYRNRTGDKAAAVEPRVGPWYYLGPFGNAEGKGFDAAYPPESGLALTNEYTSKTGEKIQWREGRFRDGEVNSLALFKPDQNDNTAVYLYREFNWGRDAEVPVSFGSDDTLTVWFNGNRVWAENVYRGCAPDQARVSLRMNPGKNRLLMKVCNGGGDFAFYFSMPKESASAVPLLFEDVSDSVGLGERGAGGQMKGTHLAVGDVNGDQRPDFVYGAGSGLLVLNTPGGFAEARDSGLAYRPGHAAPLFGDFDGDGALDLVVVEPDGCRLFQNDGKGHFRDVSAQAGLPAMAARAGVRAALSGIPVCAAWADFGGGRADLLVGCIKGPNVYLRNTGGAFFDASQEIGFHQRIFNSQAVAAADFNSDGVQDVVFNNEGQEGSLLLGNPARASGRPAR